MSHYNVYRLLGWLSLIIGIAASLCIYQIQYVIFGIGLSILGFITSGINIYMNSRFYSHEEKWPKGYLGMLFSSLPVLFLLFVIMRFKK